MADKDPRYSYSLCPGCNREWQLIDWKCSRHRLHCGDEVDRTALDAYENRIPEPTP